MTELRALIIEDNADDGKIATTALQRVGFTTELARTVRQGAYLAYELLAQDPPPLVLSDLMLPTDSQSNLDASILLADLTMAMLQGRLRPAQLVVVTSTEDQVLHETARLCGARLVLVKPFSMAYAYQLRDLFAAPPQLPTMTPMLQALGHTSKQALAALFATEPVLWWGTAEVERLLEKPETLYQPWKAWFLQRGGRDIVYQSLVDHFTEEERRAFDAMTALPRSLSKTARIELTGWSPASYYRHRAKVIEVVTDMLNAEQIKR